jgi:flagellar biosynthesis/type III secretory pathway protein FliH
MTDDETFAWREGEREQIEREMEERAAGIRKAELLAWCEREEERRATDAVTKSAAPTRRREQGMTHDVQAYIDTVVRRSEDHILKLSMEVVGEVLAEERKRVAEEHAKMRAEFEHELLKLKAEVLQAQLDEARGVKKPPLKIVPSEGMIG